MRWKGRRESENVEDRRGLTPQTVAIGGGIGGLVIIMLGLLFGVDLRGLVGNPNQAMQQGAPANAGPRAELSEAEKETGKFVSVVLADTEDVWTRLFQEDGKTYKKPTLVLFSGQVQSACGMANAAVGPFYCPGDQKVYLDTAFFEELARRFKAPGDFAQAYVVAHEIGHHVQNQLGITQQVDAQRGRLSEAEYNELSVRLELQADFLAGVWANHAQQMSNILEPGDMEEALNAAAAIGDDKLQRQTQGYVRPDSFTHGTSEQRLRWFLKGLQSGDMNQGNTFEAAEL